MSIAIAEQCVDEMCIYIYIYVYIACLKKKKKNKNGNRGEVIKNCKKL